METPRQKGADLLSFVFAAGLAQVALGIAFFIAGGTLSPTLYAPLVREHFHIFAPLTVATGAYLLAQTTPPARRLSPAGGRLVGAVPFLLLAANFAYTAVPSGVLIYGLLALVLICAAALEKRQPPFDLHRTVLAVFLLLLGLLLLLLPANFPATAYPVLHRLGLLPFAAGVLLAGVLEALRLRRGGPAALGFLAEAASTVALTALAVNFALVRVWTGVAVYASLALSPLILGLERDTRPARGAPAGEPGDHRQEQGGAPIDYSYLEFLTWFFIFVLTLIPVFSGESQSSGWRLPAATMGALTIFNVLWPRIGYQQTRRRAVVHLACLSASLSLLMMTADELKALLYLAMALVPIPLAGIVLGLQGVFLTGGITLVLSALELLRDSVWGAHFNPALVGWHVTSHGLTTAAMMTVAAIVSRRLDQYTQERDLLLADLRGFNLVLQDMATRDPLTGLYNHGFLQERLEQEINRAARSGSRLALAMLDLDRFKQVNDTFGHQVGDEVLRRLAHILRESLRSSDVAARYGGEEIAVILPETDADGAAAVLERVRQLLESAAVDVPGGQKLTGITLSAGVAVYPDAATDRHALIRAADDALYAAKAAGRNRIRVADVPAAADNDGALSAPGK